MGCTTILVGKNASYDGSTLVARTEDSSAGEFTSKKVIVVRPDDQPKVYKSVISHVTVELPENPLQYTSTPDAPATQGIWGEAGINSANVAMSATETLTTNERVLGADPLVAYIPAKGNPESADFVAEKPGGIGEEDFLTLVLPYIKSAREGVLRTGQLLEKYGTYESNGIAFSDVNEIWWLETIGGHHWIAKRVPDDSYVTMPNQLGIDSFDLDDAEAEGLTHLASPDLRAFIEENFLNPSFDGTLNPREAFGSHSDADHVYNTPRAWYMQKVLNPNSGEWNGPNPALTPFSDNIPWSRQPERKITIEDINYVLSSHYQGTKYDPYSNAGSEQDRGMFRPIGINRHSQMAILQIRPYRPESSRSIQWMAFASNPFNTLIPLFTNVDCIPEYLSDTTGRVTTENFYWVSRIIAALADAHFADTIADIERYQEKTLAAGHSAVKATDLALSKINSEGAVVREQLSAANSSIADKVREQTDEVLDKILFIASNGMRNRFARSDN